MSESNKKEDVLKWLNNRWTVVFVSICCLVVITIDKTMDASLGIWDKINNRLFADQPVNLVDGEILSYPALVLMDSTVSNNRITTDTVVIQTGKLTNVQMDPATTISIHSDTFPNTNSNNPGKKNVSPFVERQRHKFNNKPIYKSILSQSVDSFLRSIQVGAESVYLSEDLIGDMEFNCYKFKSIKPNVKIIGVVDFLESQNKYGIVISEERLAFSLRLSPGAVYQFFSEGDVQFSYSYEEFCKVKLELDARNGVIHLNRYVSSFLAPQCNYISKEYVMSKDATDSEFLELFRFLEQLQSIIKTGLEVQSTP